MKMPWKKNLNKLPTDTLHKLESFEVDSFIKVAGSKDVKKTDITEGKYEHLGIMYENAELSFPSFVMPKPVGRYSKYNIEGRARIRRDLPKVDKTFTHEVPHFGDWSKGSHTFSSTRKVFQKEFWLPKELMIEINSLAETEDAVTFKFSVDRPLKNTGDVTFQNELLYYCNVLQENTGMYDIFPASATDQDYIKTLFVEWELLPPGTENLERNVKHLLGKHRSPNEKLEGVYKDRLTFFDSLKPREYISGTDGFNRYFGAKLKDDLVILENSRYGNALYIFFEDWQELSKLSRGDLLMSQDKDFERVTHNGNWKNRVTNVIANHESEAS
ncbi:hypothetical protein ACQCVO_05385 [Bacillus infantis]|uniref:hypothetical protein n=1 Tax=Bacillus infantis TaxID=324767 RepID=UPI003CE72962